MKTIILVCALCILSSCASVSYTKPDGTKLTYTRVFTTADSMDVQVGDSTAKINGQKINLEAFQALMGLAGIVK
jgi:ABC-type glycerol-3-phosphate transport system substrate-binding protein